MRWGYRNLLEMPLALSANWLSWVSEHAFAFVCMGVLKLVTRRFIYFFNAEYYLNVVSECDIEALLACWALKFKCNASIKLWIASGFIHEKHPFKKIFFCHILFTAFHSWKKVSPAFSERLFLKLTTREEVLLEVLMAVAPVLINNLREAHWICYRLDM